MEEARKRRLPGITIDCVSRLLESPPVQEALDIACDGVRSHDQRRI